MNLISSDVPAKPRSTPTELQFLTSISHTESQVTDVTTLSNSTSVSPEESRSLDASAKCSKVQVLSLSIQYSCDE